MDTGECTIKNRVQEWIQESVRYRKRFKNGYRRVLGTEKGSRMDTGECSVKKMLHEWYKNRYRRVCGKEKGTRKDTGECTVKKRVQERIQESVR